MPGPAATRPDARPRTAKPPGMKKFVAHRLVRDE
jgi:hypothetical protein